MPFDATPVTNAIEAALEPWQHILLSAADIMEKRGGCKGSLENYYGRVCALGALSAAAYGDPLAASQAAEYLEPSTPFMKAVIALCHQIGAPTASLDYDPYILPRHIAAWNNRESRPTTYIIATMREAALAASHH